MNRNVQGLIKVIGRMLQMQADQRDQETHFTCPYSIRSVCVIYTLYLHIYLSTTAPLSGEVNNIDYLVTVSLVIHSCAFVCTCCSETWQVSPQTTEDKKTTNFTGWALPYMTSKLMLSCKSSGVFYMTRLTRLLYLQYQFRAVTDVFLSAKRTPICW